MTYLKSASLLLAFLALPIITTAQNSPLDSLQEVLKNHKSDDTVKVALLINTANLMAWNDTDKSLELAIEAHNLATRINWQHGIAYALRQKGVALYRAGNFVEAMEQFHLALKANEILANKSFEVSLHNNLGNIHSDLKQYDKALSAYDNIVILSRNVGDKSGEVIGLVNRGLVFREQGIYDKALADLKQALVTSSDEGFTYFETAILNNLGLTYKDAQDYKAAKKYLLASIVAAGDDNNVVKSSSLNSLAEVYLRTAVIDSAALLAREALVLGEQTNSLEQQRDAWKTLSGTFESSANSSEALGAYKSYIALRDSVLNEENKSELTRKEMQYKLDVREAVSMAEIKKQRQLRNVAGTGIILLLFGGSVGYVLYKRRRDALEQKKEAEFKLNVAETELRVLRSQLNPHFIFNSLNSIGDFVIKHDADAANDYLSKFARLMRLTLEHSEKELITLEEDLVWTKLYLELEAKRLENKFDFSFTVDPSIEADNLMVPPLILQPLIENSIWHGISPKQGNGHISLTAKPDGNALIYSIEDDGVGRKTSETTPSQTSFGLKITQNRINIMSELKQFDCHIKMTDLDKGLKVEVKLPMELVY